MNVNTKHGVRTGIVSAEQMAGFGIDRQCLLRCYIQAMAGEDDVPRVPPVPVQRTGASPLPARRITPPIVAKGLSGMTDPSADGRAVRSRWQASSADPLVWEARRIEFRDASQWIEVWLLAHPMTERKKRRKMVRDFLLHAGKDPGEIAGADLDAYAAILATGSYAYFSVAQASIRAFTSFMAQRTTNPPVPIGPAPQEIQR